MASQTIQTNIVINAQANGFGLIGSTLTELGSIVDQTSRQLLNFGKESYEVYKDYSLSMEEAQIALSTRYGRDSKELAKIMSQLNEAATEWAHTTAFHTNDVADAINQAAHASWTFEEIMNGIPVAMQLAQAGGIDLSQAMTYLIKDMKALGLEYGDLSEFVDMWIYAANSSAGDVQSFGEAMKKMGATMRFTDSREELFALIGLMHDMGESGSTAATLLRTSMMRILAPSGVTSKVLEKLGATDEELKEIREDASKLAALNLLESYGFSAFDEKTHQAKPIIQVYAELGEILAQIAGGYENINKNETTLGVLGTIFGNRAITGALDIVNALQNAVELRDKLLGGEATGYGEYALETINNTLYGKTEIFESQIERLKQVFGEELSGRITSVMESIGGVVDRLAEMDNGKLSALVSGLSVIAFAGPGLLLAGKGFRMIGALLTPLGGIGLGIIGITALASALEKLKQANLEKTFGEMTIDKDEIESYIKSIGEDFKAAYEYTNQFQEALDKSVTNYRAASGTFSSNIFSLMIQNTKLTQDDLKNLLSLGDQMYDYVQEAIFSAASGNAEYWTALFGGEEEALEDPVYQRLIELANKEYTENLVQLQNIGTNMRKAITDAFTNDNKIDEDEYNQILAYMREYNNMVARAAAEAREEENYIKMNTWLQRAQTGGFSDVNELSRTAAAERDEILKQQENDYYNNYFKAKRQGASEETLRRITAKYEAQKENVSTQWDEFMITLWESQLANNGQMDNYNFLRDVADAYVGGVINSDAALNMVRNKMGASGYSGDTMFGSDNGRGQMAKIFGYLLTAMGGEEEVQRKIAYYKNNGQTEMADRLTQLYAMEQLANGFNNIVRTDPISVFGYDLDFLGDYETNTGEGKSGQNKRAFEGSYIHGVDMTEARKSIEGLGSGMDSIYHMMTEIENVVNGVAGATEETIMDAEGKMSSASTTLLSQLFQRLSETYDLNMVARDMGEQYASSFIKSYYAMWDLIYGNASKNPDKYLHPATPVSAEKTTIEPAPVKIRKRDFGSEAADPLVQLEEQGVQVNVTGDTTELTATIEKEDGQILTQYLYGDAENLHYAIMDENGLKLTENVEGNTAALYKAIRECDHQTITVWIKGKRLFAEGGRATEPSIFGEGTTPEWAIPERHSERTAELLNAARAASGFTWQELLARYGGLNANPQNTPTTIVYSPTINANDVSGVEQALRDDKRRFEQWFEEKQMRDAVEVYS